MQNFLSKSKTFILDILFPKFCLNCGEEGNYICQDCLSLIDILDRQYCPFCYPPKIVLDGRTCSYHRRFKKLNGLYSAFPYNNFIIKKFIHQFKYSYIKELSKPLTSLIVAHLINLNKLSIPGIFSGSDPVQKLHDRGVFARGLKTSFQDFVLVPIPLHKKKFKQRGFNQSEEIAKELSKTLGLPIFNNILIKIKQTLDQVELKKEEREKNIKGVFFCQKPDLIFDQKILLVDDVFTTGSTMEECALTLKRAGAKEVWGIVVARG